MFCSTVRIVQLIIVYVCIGCRYAQINNDCGLERFRCRNGQCIAGALLCDGRADCGDSSDETAAECKKPEILCPNYRFRCNYGACINGDYVCNGIRDCVDNSDETQPQCTRHIITKRNIITNNETGSPTQATPGCVGLDQFTCDNGQCISITYACDGTQNCADGSDELFEVCGFLPCSPTAFRCNYGACIDDNLRCNGEINCADGSDENSITCSGTGWSSSSFLQQTTGTIRQPLIPLFPIFSTFTRPNFTTPTSSSSSLSFSTQKCKAPPQPQNGRWTLQESQCFGEQECNITEGTELKLGFYLTYSCNLGYKIKGPTEAICSFGRKWLNIPICIEIRCKALTSASIEAKCTYNNEWVSCKSSVRPTTTATLKCQNGYQSESIKLLSGQRTDVRCNENGDWEPEPMRCVPACGTVAPDVTPLIAGGVRPKVPEFPWHTSMYIDKPGNVKDLLCGATVIQENFLITAAHCVYDEIIKQLRNASQIYTLTGNMFRDYHSPLHNGNVVKINQVKHIYINRDYKGYIGNYRSDIAVLELVRPFALSTLLVPACVDVSERIVLETGSYGKVAGFGYTEKSEISAVLQSLTVPVIPLNQCDSIAALRGTDAFITDDKFCAGYTNGSAICSGDSGGGLVFRINNLWYLRGIVSVSLGVSEIGAHCSDTYTLYTEISSHISWIRDVILKVEQNRRHVLCSTDSRTMCSSIN